MEKFKVPVVVIGSESVGKTSIIMRFCNNVFEQAYVPTLGSDYFTKPYIFGEKSIEFHVWDIGGQEQYKHDKEYYLRRAYVVIIVFAVDDPVSYMSLTDWVDDARTLCKNDPAIVLVANKIDLRDEQQGQDGGLHGDECITSDQFCKETASLGCDGAIEASAKNGTGIAEIFEVAARLSDGRGNYEPPRFSDVMIIKRQRQKS